MQAWVFAGVVLGPVYASRIGQGMDTCISLVFSELCEQSWQAFLPDIWYMRKRPICGLVEPKLSCLLGSAVLSGRDTTHCRLVVGVESVAMHHVILTTENQPTHSDVVVSENGSIRAA